MSRINVEIDGCALVFETDCAAAAARLDQVLADVFGSPYYECAVGRPSLTENAPTLRYLDRPEYVVDYSAETDVCTFAAPWAEVSESTLVGMWLFYLSELVRQRRGEYILHASAVVRHGHAIVISAAGESGKTTLALHLGLACGFKLYANNKVKVGVVGGRPCVLRGDPVFNFRVSSLRRYSPALCDAVFSAPGAGPSWQRKRRVTPASLGIETGAGPTPIAMLVLLSLDKEAAALSAVTVLEGDTTHDGFWVQANLYAEMCELIRGTRFVPLVGAAGFREFCVPSLDQSDFVRRRVAFLHDLFRTARVMTLRGTLQDCAQAILDQFDERVPESPAARSVRNHESDNVAS